MNVKQTVAAYVVVKDEDYDTRSAVVAAIADKEGVTVNKVRGLLVREGVYKAKEASTSNSSSMEKEGIVKAMEIISGKSLPSFRNASKKDLVAFWQYIVSASDAREVG